MLSQILTVLISAAIVLAVIGAVRRIRLWRQGRPEKVNILGGLAKMPGRYLHDLHDVVGRDKYISNTHVATAGGYVTTLILLVLAYVIGLYNPLVNLLLLVTSAVMFTGAIFVAKRRKNPPSNLSKGPWMRLPKSLMIFSGSTFLISAANTGILPENAIGWIIATVLALGVALGLAELLFGMTWGGPMKHAFAGALHLAWHRRQARFGGGRSTGLKTIDLEETTLGVARPSDFKWNQLLGFDACVQCGRCEKVCPAFASGQPLNPKKLIQDMVVGFAGGTTESYAGSLIRVKRIKCGAVAQTGQSLRAYWTPKQYGRAQLAGPASKSAR